MVANRNNWERRQLELRCSQSEESDEPNEDESGTCSIGCTCCCSKTTTEGIPYANGLTKRQCKVKILKLKKHSLRQMFQSSIAEGQIQD